MWSSAVGCIVTLILSVLATPCAVAAQQAQHVPRIGYLHAGSSSMFGAREEAFRQGLRELGYVEGQNMVMEWRYAEGPPDRLPALAAEFMRLKVDVIVTGGPTTTRAAKEATATIPIVFVGVGDPVGAGFVASLARPGGYLTGLSTLAPEISGKHLELLKESVSRLSRVAGLGTSSNPGNAQAVQELARAAGAFGVQLHYFDVLAAEDIAAVFRAASQERADAVLVLGSPVLSAHRTQLIELALMNRLPAIYPWPEIMQEGWLMMYGVSLTDLHRRAATYVDKILKGAKPADLPVEQPMKFELIINLKTAKALGLTMPPSLLLLADEVIQ